MTTVINMLKDISARLNVVETKVLKGIDNTTQYIGARLNAVETKVSAGGVRNGGGSGVFSPYLKISSEPRHDILWNASRRSFGGCMTAPLPNRSGRPAANCSTSYHHCCSMPLHAVGNCKMHSLGSTACYDHVWSGRWSATNQDMWTP